MCALSEAKGRCLKQIYSDVDISHLLAVSSVRAHTHKLHARHSTNQPPNCFLSQLPLISAYSNIHEANGAIDSRLQKQKQRLDQKHHEPLFTNVTKDFKGTLDYVLYTSNSLMPTAVLELPIEGEVLAKPDEQLPNATYSSDHIALLTEFQYVRS